MKPWLWSIFAYLCATALIGHPVVFGPDGALLGGGEQPDWTGTAWTYWWTEHALSSARTPFEASANFFPWGQSPTAWYNLLDAFLAAPFIRALGLVDGYNIFGLTVIFSNGLAAHILARTLKLQHRAGLVAGTFWMSSPWLLSEIVQGRLSQALMVFFLLALSGAVRLTQGPSRPVTPIVTGIAVSLCALGYWFYGFFLAIGLIAIWGQRYLILRKSSGTSTSEILRPAAIVLATCTALCIAPVTALIGGFADQPGVDRAMEGWVDQGELGQNRFGLNMTIMNGNWIFWPWMNAQDDSAPTAFPASAWIFIAGSILLARRSKQNAPQSRKPLRVWSQAWVWVWCAGYLLSLGPYLKVSNQDALAVPLPFLILHEWFPFFDRLWWPDRAAILVLAATGVLLSHQTDRLLRSHYRWKGAIPFLVILCMLAETSLISQAHPVPVRPPRPVDVELYETIDGPILTIPILGASDEARHLLWMQTVHNQPITGGLGDHIRSHVPEDYVEWVENNSFLHHLSALSQGKSGGAIIQPSDIQMLLDDGLAWIVIDHEVFPRGHDAEWGRAFRDICHNLWDRPPDIRSKRGAAWRIRPITAPVFLPLTGPLPIPNEGFFSATQPP